MVSDLGTRKRAIAKLNNTYLYISYRISNRREKYIFPRVLREEVFREPFGMIELFT